MRQTNIRFPLSAPQYRNRHGFPPTVCIELLKRCNLSCPYCRSSSTATDATSLGYQDVKELLYQLKDEGVWRIPLTGGEPFMWPSLAATLELLHELRFPFTVTTNGIGGQRVFERIDRSVWDTGTLYVSLDGNETVHDGYRGADSFRRTVQFLNQARSRVPRLFVGTVVMSDLRVWADGLADVLARVGVDNWTLISPVRSGRWDPGFNDGLATRSLSEMADDARLALEARHASTTVTTLDFGSFDHLYRAAAYVLADGTVQLPGWLQAVPEEQRGTPVSRDSVISSKSVGREIAEAMSGFLDSNGFLL